MVLAQAYDSFEPEPDEPPATSEALVRLLNQHEVGVDLPGDLWLGEREARINEAYRQRRQEEELEAYLEHGRISVEQALSLAPSIDAVRPARPRLSVATLPGADGKQPGAES